MNYVFMDLNHFRENNDKNKREKILSKAKVPIKSKMSIEEAYSLLNACSPKTNETCYIMNKIENTYDLQIIIPAYNAEQYIKDCLSSVCGQHSKYKTLVRVINDGSTDLFLLCWIKHL